MKKGFPFDTLKHSCIIVLIVSLSVFCGVILGCNLNLFEYSVPENKDMEPNLCINVAIDSNEGLSEISLTELGENYDKITYLGISGAMIDIDGTILNLEDAILDEYISIDEIISCARLDAQSGFCEEIAESENGLTKFTYRYPDFDLMCIYDLYETPDGEQHLISEFGICEPKRTPSFLYMDDATGKPIDYEDWGLNFSVVETRPNSITMECIQSGGQQMGELLLRSYILYKKNPDGESEDYIEPLIDEFMGESDPNITIRKESTTEISIDFSHLYGELPTGNYVIYLIINDQYSDDALHPLMRNYYDEQFFGVTFSIE